MDSLASELLVAIFLFVPYLKLVQCRRVCKRFKDIIDNTSEIQYLIEFAAAGYTGEQTTGLPIKSSSHESLLILQKEQKALRKISLRLEQSIGITDNTAFNTFITSAHFPPPTHWNFLWQTYADIVLGFAISTFDYGPVIGILSLKSAVSPHERFRTIDIGVVFMTFAIDVSQDLILIFSARRIFLRSLSTGARHPRSKINIRRHEDVRICSRHVSVSGDWLLYSHVSDPQRQWWYHKCYLYHWPTGKIALVWTDVNKTPDRRLPPTCLVGSYLLRCQFGLLEVLKLNVSPENAFVTHHVASYAFPGLSNKDKWLACGIQSLDPHRSEGYPSILAIAVDSDRSFYCVPTEKLLTDEVRSHDGRSAALDIPWSSWGPKAGHVTRISRSSPGQQVVGHHWKLENAIVDFNAYDAAHNIYGQSARRTRLRSSTEPVDEPAQVDSTLVEPGDALELDSSTATSNRAQLSTNPKFGTAVRWTTFSPPVLETRSKLAATGEYLVRDGGELKLVQVLYAYGPSHMHVYRPVELRIFALNE